MIPSQWCLHIFSTKTFWHAHNRKMRKILALAAESFSLDSLQDLITTEFSTENHTFSKENLNSSSVQPTNRSIFRQYITSKIVKLLDKRKSIIHLLVELIVIINPLPRMAPICLWSKSHNFMGPSPQHLSQ